MPQISVIVPVYKVEPYICRCVDSILAQTYSDFELILVDDGSPDGSGEISDEYASNDSRILVIHKHNRGQASARNNGIDISQGVYIGFIDSDDYISETMYETLYRACNNDTGTVAVCGRINVDEYNGESTLLFCLDRTEEWTRIESLKRFLTWDKIDGSSCDKLIPRTLINSNRYPEGYICEDIPFIFEILQKCKKVVHVPDAFYYYLQRNGSTSKPKRITEKDGGIVRYNEEIYRTILNENSQLKSQAEYFYFSRCIIFQSWIINRGGSIRILSENKKRLRTNRQIIIENPYFSEYDRYLTGLYTNTAFTVKVILVKCKQKILEWLLGVN